MSKPTYSQLQDRVKELENNLHNILLTQEFLPEANGKKHAVQAAAQTVDADISNKSKSKVNENLAKLQSILDSTVDGIMSIEIDGRISSFNRTAELIFQYKGEEIIGKNVKVLLPKPFSTELQKKLAKHTRTGKVKTSCIKYEVEGKRKDGSIFPLFLEISKTKANGKILFTAVLKDITERKKNEQDVMKLRAALDLSSDQIYQVDPVTMKFLDVNQHTLAALGFTKEEMMQMQTIDIKPYYTKKQLREKYNQVIKSEMGVGKIETTHRRKDGSEMRVVILLSRLEISGKNVIVAVARDCTEQLKNKEALRISEERYALAQKAANIGSWDWNIETGNLAWSEAIEPMFGFKKNKFGATFEAFLECVHPDDRDFVTNSLDNTIEGKKGYNVEFRIVWPDKSVHWVSTTGQVLRDSHGKAYRMLGIVQDITKKKKLELKLGSLRKEYEAFMRHEMNNYLAPITNYVQILLNSPQIKINEVQSRYLEKIKRSVFNAVGLIKNLKKLQDFEQGKYSFETERFSLNALMDHVVDSFVLLEDTLGVKFDYSVEEGDYFMNMDINLLTGVFHNLIKNAIQHVQDLKAEKDKIIKIRMSTDQGTLKALINNKGTPVSPERLALFFEKFNTDKSTKKEGSGLGTTYAYLVTKAHRGKIWVESNEKEGTTLFLEFKQKKKGALKAKSVAIQE